MLKNYFKVAFRALWQNKAFSALNILGLSLGMACSLLILLWVRDEQGVDSFHSNKNQLYILYERGFSPDKKINGDYSSAAPLGAELKRTIPEIQFAVSTDWGEDFTFQGNGKAVKATGAFSGEDFFRMFSFPILRGNAATLLDGPANIAISKTLATKLFGSPDAAMGKTLRRDQDNNWKNFVVTGVFDDPPQKSSFQFEFMMGWKAYYEDHPGWEGWDNSGPYTMIQLRPDADPNRVAAKLERFLDKYRSKDVPGYHKELGMQRFDQRYLRSSFVNGYPTGGRIEYVRLFSLVAIFILVIACINFMNLTTARSVRRAKEIGIRKVIGARKGSLIGQFMGEAILQATLAMAVALLAVFLSLPVFNAVTGKQMVIPVSNVPFWLELLGLTLATGVLSGSYPALYLSSFRPIAVLKGMLKTGTGSILLRKGLVVFQFVLSITLIIGTIVVTKQVHYIQSMNIGFNREGLVYVPIEGTLSSKFDVFKEEGVKLSGVQQMALMSEKPTFIDNGTSSLEWSGKPANFKPTFAFAAVSFDFMSTVGAHIVEGRDFSPAFATDSLAFILNEEAVRNMGLKHASDAIGMNLGVWDLKGKIVGVVNDFHFNSLHDPIKPLILISIPSPKITSGEILVRTKPGQAGQAIAALQQLCHQINPAFPFTYQFADAEYQKLYTDEAVIGKLSNYFAGMAILISSLGLLGLVMFTAEQRTKEIGIRKVLGAGVGQLFALLARDFVWLVILAFIIAAPLAGWALHSWLQEYAYHTQLSAIVFVVAGLLALLIALATISYHAARASLANPVKSLRAE